MLYSPAPDVWRKAGWYTMASGEYIWIAESDDYAHTDLLQTLVEILNQHLKKLKKQNR